ncbi:MAG: hypothetical protein IM631_13255 [Cytophagales bacterium]|jgi:hypothetical protein|nr:hypothetical protein [Cytophagales bacterium]MCA6372341.1 hypothetical protein [Cytophagales bacterium]MCA6382487.1 hypothetical protein [Cytophagales bacterium]
MNNQIKSAGFIFMCIVGVMTAGYTYATFNSLSKYKVSKRVLGEYTRNDSTYAVVEFTTRYDGDTLDISIDTLARKGSLSRKNW